MSRRRNPVNFKKLPGSKWTAVQPVERQKHFAVLDWVRDDDGVPTGMIAVEAILTGAVRVMHWRELADPETWRIGWQ